METIPIADKNFYSVKIVNGHPPNPKYGKLTVVAIGLLFEVEYGYPLLITEATLLTAIELEEQQDWQRNILLEGIVRV